MIKGPTVEVHIKDLVETKALILAAADALDALRKVEAKQITMNNGTHRSWIEKRVRALQDALQPFTSSDTPGGSSE